MRSFSYVAMDLVFITALATFAYNISTYVGANGSLLDGNAGIVAKWAAWAFYCMSRSTKSDDTF